MAKEKNKLKVGLKDSMGTVILRVSACFIFLCGSEVCVSALPLSSMSVYLLALFWQPARFFSSTEFLGITLVRQLKSLFSWSLYPAMNRS